MDILRAEHHLYRLQYHLVWTPKYRHPVFTEPYRSTLLSILRKAAYDYDIDIQELEIPPDHIHALISLPPPMSISECMRILKSISAREFFRQYPAIKDTYFWGGKLYSPSYYVETIGRVNEKAITAYIQNQLKTEDEQLQLLSHLNNQANR